MTNTKIKVGSPSSIPETLVSGAIKNGAEEKKVQSINTSTGEKTSEVGYKVGGSTYSEEGDKVAESILGSTTSVKQSEDGSIVIEYYYPPGPSYSGSSTPPPPECWCPPPPPPPPPLCDPEPDPPEPPKPDLPGRPSPPSPPRYESFNTPEPTFSSKLERANKFVYFMGIDSINIQSKRVPEKAGRILKEIDVEGVRELELKIEDYISPSTSVEYSILDGDKETPILPLSSEKVDNEKLFGELPTRFEMDPEREYTVKRNGDPINISIDEAQKRSDGSYSLCYYPLGDPHKYSPVNDQIRIKVILRTYKEETVPPSVSSIKVKKHMKGETTWMDDLS